MFILNLALHVKGSSFCCRLCLDDGVSLLQQVVNLDKNTDLSNLTKKLLDKVCYSPLGIVCAGILLREKLSQKEIISIDKAVSEICQDIDDQLHEVKQLNQYMGEFLTTDSGHMLVVMETVVSMAMDLLLTKDRYLHHGFDFMATLKPGAAIPQTLLTRHFRIPVYKLPPLQQSRSGFAELFNKGKNDLETVKNKVDEFEPKGKAWSNKNLVEYIRKVEDFFTTGVSTVKEIYNLIYGELPMLPEHDDGLDMFRDCELLLTSRIEPGGMMFYTTATSQFSLLRNQLTLSILSIPVED